jgi:hypothetical protein
MDAPVRGYVHQVGEDGRCKPVTTKVAKRRREKAFAVEYALLAELGLYDEHGHRIASPN